MEHWGTEGVTSAKVAKRETVRSNILVSAALLRKTITFGLQGAVTGAQVDSDGEVVCTFIVGGVSGNGGVVDTSHAAKKHERQGVVWYICVSSCVYTGVNKTPGLPTNVPHNLGLAAQSTCTGCCCQGKQ